MGKDYRFVKRRVVITGMGAVSPYGLGVDKFIRGIWTNTSAVTVMEEWEDRGLRSHLAAPVPDFDVKKAVHRMFRRNMGGMALYAAIAAREAVEDSKIDSSLLAAGRVGVVMGSTTGSPEAYEAFYEKFFPDRRAHGIKSGLFFKIMGHTCSANTAQFLGVSGEQWASVSACASSSQAIGLGFLLISSGRQDVMICGGADEVHHTVTMVFDVVGAASLRNSNPDTTPSPFDVRRDGVVCGGGSGVVMLESLEHARRRGARIYGEIAGFGNTTDSGHISNPSPLAMKNAMLNAIKEAGITRDDISYVNAHATGTVTGDAAEAEAISMIFGKRAPVSSLKGHFGHTLGAAGSLETIAVLKMIERQELVPTLNLDEPAPDCNNINLLRKFEKMPVCSVLKNNFALGGVNTSIVLRSVD